MDGRTSATVVNVIEAERLRKEFTGFRRGRTLAVDGLDLTVPQGGVFGFLGPNGSGKTTTIRCMLGLVAPTSGRVRLLGADHAHLQPVIGRVGALVESPALFPGFSGRRNLELLAAMEGLDGVRVDAALERVGLAGRARDMVKGYSLGMRQRLAIAAALLKDPEVLILDEPANGLDPAGIKEVRDLLRSLGDEGRTVFLSSHLLGEIEQICDSVAILSRGRCIASGPVHEILTQGKTAGVIVRAEPVEAALAALAAAKMDAVARADGSIRVEIEPSDAQLVTRALVRKRIYLSELRPDEVSLENVFLDLIATAEGGARCSQCSAALLPHAKFCRECGAPVA